MTGEINLTPLIFKRNKVIKMPADRYYKLRSGIAKILKKHLGKDFWQVYTSDITTEIEQLIICGELGQINKNPDKR